MKANTTECRWNKTPGCTITVGHPRRTCNSPTQPLFNVIAVNIATGAERIIAENKTEDNADAIVAMAVMRRGVEEEFFKTVKI